MFSGSRISGIAAEWAGAETRSGARRAFEGGMTYLFGDCDLVAYMVAGALSTALRLADRCYGERGGSKAGYWHVMFDECVAQHRLQDSPPWHSETVATLVGDQRKDLRLRS